jgi:hypothetical protein
VVQGFQEERFGASITVSQDAKAAGSVAAVFNVERIRPAADETDEYSTACFKNARSQGFSVYKYTSHITVQ